MSNNESSSNDSVENDFRHLRVITLTHENKQHLLKDAINASHQSMAETKMLMERLERYQLPMAQQFEFRASEWTKVPFKLIKSLENRPSREDQASSESFIALSYCWHNNDWMPTRSCSPTKEWPISAMMLRELLNQRDSPNEGIWIDACCIDQSNPDEKRSAIAAMDLIYRSARQVVIALEDVNLSDEQEFLLRNTLAHEFFDASPGDSLSEEQLCGLCQILINILSARWFSRAWCSHELQTSTRHIFLVPAESRIIVLKHGDLDDLYWHTYPTMLSRPDMGEAMESISLGFDIYSRVALTDRAQRSYMAEFVDISRLKASIQTDKISIAMNVVGLQLYYKGDFKSAEQIKWILAMIALCAGDLTVLGGDEEAFKVGAGLNARSWLNWGESIDERIASTSPHNFIESSIESMDESHITLDLIIFKTATFHYPSINALNLAIHFCKTCISAYPGDNGGEWLGSDRNTKEFKDKALSRIQLVACSLDCGLQWIIDTATHVISQDTSIEKKTRDVEIEENFYLQPIALTLLDNAYSSQLPTLKNLKTEQKRAITHYFFFMLFIFEVSAIGDYTRQDFKGFAYRVLNMASGSRAITRFTHSDRPKEEFVYAMPAALASPSCATIRRLWILTPMEPGRRGSPWKIFDKKWLFAFSPFEKDDPGVEYWKNQRIEGLSERFG